MCWWNQTKSQESQRRNIAMEASKALPSVQSIYLSRHDQIIEPLFVKVAPYIQRTLDTHYVKRPFNSKEVCVLDFYRSSNDLETLLCAMTEVQRARKTSVIFVRNLMMQMKCGFSVLLAKYGSMRNNLKNNFYLSL